MNKYFALRKTNRMRTKLLTEESQAQLKEVIRYLCRVSWDFCGIELLRSDLLDIAIQANKENQELFHSISDAKTFVDEVKPSLKTLRAGDYFWYVAPLYFFFGWGIEGLLLYPIIGNWVFELSVGYLMQLVVAVAAFLHTVPPDDGAGGLSAARALAEICCMAGALYRDSVWNGLVLYPNRGQSRVAAASDP